MNLEQAIQSSTFVTQKQKAGLNILYTAWWLKTIASRELKAFGLTHEQFNVLRILKGKHPEQMCIRDIAQRMIEKNSNVPRIIDRLLAKKLVERFTSNVDKRETVIKLTDLGMSVLISATRSVDKVFAESIAMDEDNAILLNSLLESFRQKE